MFSLKENANLIKLVYVLFQNINLNSTLINIRSKKLFCSFSRVKAPKWHLCRFSKNNVEETSLFAWWKFLKKFSIIPWGLHYTRRIFHLVMSKTPLRCFLHACRLICHAIFRVEENKKSVQMLQICLPQYVSFIVDVE